MGSNSKTVILLHGWGCNSNYFNQLQKHLSKNFKVYALDLPGFGLSTIPNNILNIMDYSYVIKDFVQKLNIFEPILLGHSFGGKIILNIVGNNLINTKKIILIGSSGVNLKKSYIIKIKILFYKLTKYILKSSLIKFFFGSKLEYYCKKCGSNDYQNTHGIMRNIMVKTVNENINNLLDKISIPVLLLWGENDRITPLSAGLVLNKGLINSQLKIVPLSGHFPFLDNLECVKVELDKFLI